MIGRATLTTVPSIKDMLEPRIVAARTHRRVAASRIGASAADRTTASSQGPLPTAAISR